MITKLSGINPDACSKRFVTASMNLADTANARLSRILQNKAVTPTDNSMSERIASYVASKSPFQMSPAKAEEIIPENSINYLG